MKTSFRHGWHDARVRLGTRFPLAAALCALACVAVAGLLEGQAVVGPSGVHPIALALLEGATFGLIVPLYSFASSSRVDGRLEVLMRSPGARYGDNRRAYALGQLTFPALTTLAVGVIAGSLAVALALASRDPSTQLGPDATPSFLLLVGTAALAAASYTGALGLAQLLGGTWARAAFLFLDWLLGSGEGLLAWPWPRSHIRALLGGLPVLGASGMESVEWLLVLSLFSAVVYVTRLPR
jgi:hypothetical protein